MTTEDPVPADIKAFLIKHIDSVAQLEALLLMHRQPDERWSVPPMARRIYTSEQEASELLDRLASDGLLGRDGDRFTYHCPDPESRATIGRLATIYARHLIPVTNLIHGKPRRIRQFADAFKFRKER